MYMMYKNETFHYLKYEYSTMCYIYLNTLSIKPYTLVLFETGFHHVVLAGLKLSGLKLKSPCLCFRSAVIKGCVPSLPVARARTHTHFY